MSAPAAFNRRSVLAAGAAGLALSGTAWAKTPASATTTFRAALDRFADQILALQPEQATSLGVDTGKRAPLRFQLGDASEAGDQSWARQVRAMIATLGKIDRRKLSGSDQVRYDTVKYAAERGVDGLAFSYAGAAQGFGGGASPYVISQQNGAITGVPEFLDSQHPIAGKADAEAYVSRVRALARVLDEETARLKRDAAAGVVPPAFIAATALGQLKGFRATPAAQQKLVTSIASRTQAQGIAGDWAAQANALVEKEIYPALDRQIAAFADVTGTSSDIAGVQRLPKGEDYYRWALKLGTTTDRAPDEIHRIGIDQNKAIQARMDAILKAQGFTQGTVGERLQALNKDPNQLFADNDEGRAALIAYLNGRIAAIRPLMPKMSHLGLKADVTVKRVPPDIQDGASLGYMNFASLDGKRPAIYYVNLKSTTLWPKYQLSTLTAHEGVPGHTWQGAYLAEHHAELPLISSQIGFNAFVEGWALYAEQLCDELGLYESDPFGRLGYLQAQQFRACRLVVDTGLHSKGWTRAQAVRFLVSETGRGEQAMTSETDRYCASPGQACGYKTGHNEILRLREKAKTALGAKFDLASFNDALVKTGGVPLTVLESVVDRYVEGG